MMRPLGILLIFAAVALGVAGALLANRSVFYSSSAVVKVTRDRIDILELTGSANSANSVSTGAADAIFIETEIAIIKSEATLDAVITQAKLNEAWGERLRRGHTLETSQSFQMLKERVEAKPGAEPNLIQIKALSEVPAEAAQIANAVSKAYCEYRADYRRRFAQRAMDTVAGKYAEAEKEISASRAKVEQAWQQLDPELQALAATNAATTDGVMRTLHARFSDSLLRYLAASNQLARFPETNAANVEIIEQLKARLSKASAELTEAENATKSEMRRVELLKGYQRARFEFEELTQRFAPLKKTVEELQNDLHPKGPPPASVVESAVVPTLPDVRNPNRNQWILPTAGVALLLGVGLLIVGRGPKKAAA